MSIFKRIMDIFRSNRTANEPAKSAFNGFEQTGLGDIIDVDLEQYVVSGKITYFDPGHDPHRYAYYMKAGKDIQCLIVDKGRNYDCLLLKFVEGSLDDPNDVPSILNVDEKQFNLEYYRNDRIRTEGNVDYRTNDNVMYWRYMGPGEEYFILQWQDGKYVAMTGERVAANEVKFISASATK